jgi:hypothetical protein
MGYWGVRDEHAWTDSGCVQAMVRQCYPDRFERGVEEARLENDQTTKPVQGSPLAMGVS